MEFSSFIFVPTILFLTLVAPIWIIMHYTTRKREAKTLLAEEQEALDELVSQAERMEARIANLEKILDAEAPDWRSRDDGVHSS